MSFLAKLLKITGILTQSFWIHFPVGVINVYLFRKSRWLGFGALVSFLTYEIVEDARLAWKHWRQGLTREDMAYKDIRGFLFGLFTTGLFMRFKDKKKENEDG